MILVTMMSRASSDPRETFHLNSSHRRRPTELQQPPAEPAEAAPAAMDYNGMEIVVVVG